MNITQQIKELIEQCTWFVKTLYAMALELENQDKRIKALEENRKVKDAAILDLQKKVATIKLLDRKKVPNA